MKGNHIVKIVLFFVFISLVSCGGSYGDRIKTDDLEVYYTHSSDRGKAESVTNYFKENGLTSGERQSLQLSRQEGAYVLKLILNDSEKKELTEEEKDLLNFHEKQMGNTIFEGANFEIEIANEHFETIIKLKDH